MGELSFLLDTHALLWWLFDDRRLSTRARELIADPDSTILVSSASGWEISTKHRLGKLTGVDQLVADIPGWIGRAGFTELAIGTAHAVKAGAWTQSHRDPFDRVLAAQSALEDVPIVSRDSAFADFGVRVVW